ncbi:autotransporter domain-containing protein [Pseudomonas sp. P66]|uniref:Autotransporter domain-containing protein n=1 Tax=Pseudomonas arcuscaelestis TaxID=2710591 RepID=A0ABS2C0G6_9PSED|nr:autotransporter domain-containing protein [Pseudomonas arcuscaelestis]MBM5458813.1 autotransporter domain-containing protein [Pseudomonas arcuscaelestis]
MRVPFNRSLLAAAVGALSANLAIAADRTYDMSDGGQHSSFESYDNIYITGEYGNSYVPGPNGTRFFDFDHLTLAGAFVNNGWAIEVGKNDSSALRISDSRLAGGYQNLSDGAWSVRGAGSYGAHFNNVVFGTAGASGVPAFLDNGRTYNNSQSDNNGKPTGALGIFGSTFNGNVVLNGFYGAAGDHVRAVEIGDSLDNPSIHSEIFGNLIVGDDADLRGGSFVPTLSLTNVVMRYDSIQDSSADYGYLNLGGTYRGAVGSALALIKGSQFKGLNFTGSMLGVGPDSIGILLDGNTLLGDHRSSISGIISAGQAAIKISNDTTNDWVFDLSGHLVSQGDAFLGSLAAGNTYTGTQTINWNGGSITGNVRDVTKVDVFGDVVLTAGYEIGSPLTLYSGSNLTIEYDPGQGGQTATVTGGFHMLTGSTLSMRIGEETLGGAPILSVRGGVEFDTGTTLRLIPSAANFQPYRNTIYTLISSDYATGLHNLQLVSASALFDVIASYSADGNTLYGTAPGKFGDGNLRHDLGKGSWSFDGRQFRNGRDAIQSLLTFGEQKNGAPGSAVFINRAEIAGAVSNEGIFSSAVEGTFAELSSSTIGSVHNSGQITLNAESTGYSLYESWIEGDFTNTGSISAGTGLWASRSGFLGDIRNSGTINAIGAESSGIRLDDDTSWRAIRNDGSITAVGTGSAGILVDGAGVGLPYDFDENGDPIHPTGYDQANTGIFNTGSIHAQGTGIEIRSLDGYSMPLVIHQAAGEISGGTAAINANGLASLKWTGGEISGDILGLQGVAVDGDAVFSGTNIESPTLDLDSGSLTVTGATLQGDLNAASGSLLKMYLSDMTDPLTPILDVTGKATFATNTGIQLLATPGAFSPTTSNRYTLLRAGQLIGGENVAVTSASALLEVSRYGAIGNQIQADVNGVKPADPGDGGTTPPTEPGDGSTTPPTEPGDGGTTPPTEPGDGGTTPPTEPGDGGTTPPTEPGDGGTTPPTEPGDGGTTPPTESGDGGTTPPTEPGDGEISIGLKPDDKIRDELTAAGGSPNDANALIPLAKDVLSKLEEDDPVFEALANAGTAEELVTISKQLTPEVAGATRTAAIDQQLLVNDALNGRSVALRAGLSSGEEIATTGVWFQALHTESTQDSRGSLEGYSARSNGFVLGADGKIREDLTIGVAFSTLSTDVGVDGGNSIDISGQALTIYGTGEFGNWFVDGSVMAGVNKNESKRYIVGTLAKADYDSQLFGISTLAGYKWKPSDLLVIEPRAGLRYSSLHIDKIDEKGSSASLAVGDQRYERAELGAGVRIATTLKVGKGTFEPELKVMGWHDFIGDVTQTTSTYVAGDVPFTTTGASVKRNTLSTGLGVNYKRGQWEIGLNYERNARTDYESDTVGAKLRYNF